MNKKVANAANKSNSLDKVLVVKLLKQEGCTLAVLKKGEVYTSHEAGVAPLMNLLSGSRQGLLEDAFVADKVIGKAAALLMILGGIESVYTDVISVPALKCFETHNIPVVYNLLVERIENRTHTGLCPMESLCLDINEPKEAYIQIADSPMFKGIKREEIN